MSEFTTDQIADAIPLAIQDCQWEAVEGLLRMLAVRDPRRAELYMEAIQLGIALHPSTTHPPGE